MSSPTASRVVPGLILGALSLLSAFLLFQVQPIISKFILPWFGGSPGVWTTCMLFFQIVLFAGYAYAHTLTLLPRKWQGILHGLLLGAAIALLPIAPSEMWKPTGTEDPAMRILLLLAVSVGLPYFVLSSTSPLVQVWFTRTTGGANPWRLYALSNIGSLAALLSYPLFFEVRWDVVEQTVLWSVAFIAFVIFSISGVWMDRRHALDMAEQPPVVVDKAADHPGWGRRFLWVLLPALASCVLLSATNHVCQDVAVIPFLWVVPLSLYLLTFIICFEHERWYARVPVLWAVPALVLLFVTCTEDRMQKQGFWGTVEKIAHEEVEPLLNKVTNKYVEPALNEIVAVYPALRPGKAADEAKIDLSVDLRTIDLTPNFIWELGWSFGAMFLACMLCHGELTRLKPAPRRLTEFYLLMSFGGALGGLFVSLGAPRIFKTFAEWPISLIAVFLLASIVMLRSVWRARRWKEWVVLALLAAVVGVEGWVLVKHGLLTKEALASQVKLDAVVPKSVIWSTVGVIIGCVIILTVRFARRGGGLRVGALLSMLLLGVQFSLALLLMKDLGFKDDKRIVQVRNFYGMLSVSEDYDSGLESHYRQLSNGGIVHGSQNMAMPYRTEPTSYYGHQTGIGKALDSLKASPNARVGVVGMGAGTVSCYGKSGHTYRFYDINPEVVRVAQQHFTYLDDLQLRGAKLEIVIADARLAMEREPAQQFDVLLLDAFSGDSVPVHLLTREAFAIYQRHMKPDGIIAVHITNSYLVLAPVIEKIAKDVGYKTTRIATLSDDADHDSTDYILVTNNEGFLAANPTDLVGNEVVLKEEPRLWTDRYHNLLRILDIPWNVVPDEEESSEE
ncbi:MAG TPA: fused MFS/spermidine synthase [Prosthecobacter sp.]